MLVEACKVTSFGAIQTLCPMTLGGTFILSGTSQGQVTMYSFDVSSGKMHRLITSRYFFGGVNQILFTQNRDIGILMDSGLIFVKALYDSDSKEWSLVQKNEQEVYCQKTQSTLMVEYEPGMYLISSLFRRHFVTLDRMTTSPSGSKMNIIVDSTVKGSKEQGYHDL